MTARLVGVGVGPGAPDLLTLRAVKLLREADLRVAPRASDYATSTAWTIAAPHLEGCRGETVFATFPMSTDPDRVRPAVGKALGAIAPAIEAGKTVAFLTEGDPSVFSTFTYLRTLASRRWPDLPIEVVPAVSSLTAVPAAAGIALADGQERVAIVPAAYGTGDLGDILDRFDTTLIMKIGPAMDEVVDLVEERGLLDRAVYVSRATMSGERLERDLRTLRGQRGDCFAMAMVARKERSGLLLGEAPGPPPIGSANPEPRRPMALYAITVHGIEHAASLQRAFLGADLFVSRKLLDRAPAGALPLPLPMGPPLAELFPRYDCHVFVISVGAVVRMIAPLLRDKKVDPAVVCVDDVARHAICVLSGHVGRGNQRTHEVAEALGAAPIITTASDSLGTLTVDILGRELGWTLDDPERNVTRGCAAVVNAAPTLFVQEAGEPGWWPQSRPLPPGVHYASSLDDVDPDAWEILLIASDRDLARSHPDCFANAVVYRPKSLVLGLGCDRGTPRELVERGVRCLLREHGLVLESVRAIATIDVKRDEEALLALCERHGWPLLTYPAAELDAVPGIENPSETVRSYVGTRSVGEAAALLGAGAGELLVPKQRYTEPEAGRSMTLAVARIPHPRRQEVPS